MLCTTSTPPSLYLPACRPDFSFVCPLFVFTLASLNRSGKSILHYTEMCMFNTKLLSAFPPECTMDYYETILPDMDFPKVYPIYLDLTGFLSLF